MNITRNILESEGLSEKRIEKILSYSYKGKTIKEWDQLVLDINALDSNGVPKWFEYQVILTEAVTIAKMLC